MYLIFYKLSADSAKKTKTAWLCWQRLRLLDLAVENVHKRRDVMEQFQEEGEFNAVNYLRQNVLFLSTWFAENKIYLAQIVQFVWCSV